MSDGPTSEPSRIGPTRRLRVVLLVPTLEQSGAEKQLALLAAHLPRDEFAVEVVALTRGGYFAEELRRSGVPVHVIGKRWKLDPVALVALRRLVRRLAPDVLHAWMFTANAYARLAFDGRTPPAIVVSERGSQGWKAPWQHWLDRWLVGRAARLVVNSSEVASETAARGFPPERIVVVRNALVVPIDDGSRGALGAAARGSARVVGYVGRLAPGKRVDDLIRAVGLLRAEVPEVVLAIVGDGPCRGELERLVRDLGAAGHVELLGHRPDAERLLQRFSAFWLASESEGQSNSLMEAMAAGVPVVVSDIATNRELVSDGVTGHVVPLGDPGAIAAATARLWRDSAATDAIVRAARERIGREFGVAAMVEAYARLYREISRSC